MQQRPVLINPYTSPQPGYAPVQPASPSPRFSSSFQSLETIGYWTSVVLGILAACRVISSGWLILLNSDYAHAAIESRGGTGVLLALAGLCWMLLDVALTIAAGVIYFVWLYRAYANLTALGAKVLETTPGWAIGHYFIPLVSFIRPYQTICEIWSRSVTGGRAAPSTAIVGWWWACWIGAMVCGQLGRAIGDGGLPFSCLANWIATASAVLAAIWVHRISGFQAAKHVEVLSQPVAPPPPAAALPSRFLEEMAQGPANTPSGFPELRRS